MGTAGFFGSKGTVSTGAVTLLIMEGELLSPPANIAKPMLVIKKDPANTPVARVKKFAVARPYKSPHILPPPAPEPPPRPPSPPSDF